MGSPCLMGTLLSPRDKNITISEDFLQSENVIGGARRFFAGRDSQLVVEAMDRCGDVAAVVDEGFVAVRAGGLDNRSGTEETSEVDDVA